MFHTLMSYVSKAIMLHDSKEIGQLKTYKIPPMIFPQYFCVSLIYQQRRAVHTIIKLMCVEIVGIEWKQNIVVYSIELNHNLVLHALLYHMGIHLNAHLLCLITFNYTKSIPLCSLYSHSM